MFSDFWRGFFVGACFFSAIGVTTGLLTAAMCQAGVRGRISEQYLDGLQKTRWNKETAVCKCKEKIWGVSLTRHVD